MGRIKVLLCYPGHFILKGCKIICEGLWNQSSTVCKKQDSFLNSRIPQTPDNLKCCIRFTCTGSHHQQDSILTSCNCLYSPVDRIDLIIPRLLIRIIYIIWLIYNFALRRANAVLFYIHFPKSFRWWKPIERKNCFPFALLYVAIMENKSISIRRKNKRYIHHLRVVQCLLHTVRHRMVVILCFNNGNWFIGLVKKNIVCL